MSEAFVETMKRDYVYTSDCVDAKTVMRLIADWIKDYNENAPHSGLRIMSPVEYRQSINPGV
jgi:transposase InsO family protein